MSPPCGAGDRTPPRRSSLSRRCPCRTASAAPTAPGASGSAWTATAQVEVVLPRRSPERHAEEAVRAAGAVDRAAQARGRRGAARRSVARPGPSRTWARRCGWCPSRAATRVHRRGDALLVPEGDPREALERWYRRQARVEIAPRLDAACARAGTSYTGLTIRGQNTRWASRSSTGAMSFNWRLLLAPPEILDYVVEHEVAHIEVMDHSPRFWRCSPRARRAGASTPRGCGATGRRSRCELVRAARRSGSSAPRAGGGRSARSRPRASRRRGCPAALRGRGP